MKTLQLIGLPLHMKGQMSDLERLDLLAVSSINLSSVSWKVGCDVELLSIFINFI